MLFSFSDAHLDDLKDSPRHYVEADLLLMGKYVNDNYFMHDLIREKKTIPYLATPIVAFNDKDYEAYDQVLKNPFDLDNLFKELDDTPYTEVIKGALKSVYEMPLPHIDIDDKSDLKAKEFTDKVIPSYNENMNISDLMTDIWPYSKSLLENENELSGLRRFIASYLDKEDISFELWGLEFNERFKNSPFGKTFIEMVEGVLTENEKNNFYQKFNRVYCFLEIFNITQERSGKKLKKFDLESLYIDAHHAWYASFNDFLVSDDKGLQVKAAIMYSLFNIPTKILSSTNFVNMKSILIDQEETYEKFKASFIYDIKHSMQLYNRVDPLKGEEINTFKTSHPYFNYFNRYQIIKSKEDTPLYVFYCERESHGDFFMYREIELIVNKLTVMLGLDSAGKGVYDFEEIHRYQVGDYIRQWNIGNLRFSLLTSSVSWGTPLCLSITF